MAALTIATAPAAEPLSTAEAKSHLRVTTSADDTLIDAMVKAARVYFEESLLGRALITQTWDYYLDGWPASNAIQIPKPPLASVTHVKYTDEDGTQSTFSSSDYSVDTDSFFGRVVLDADASWPADNLHPKNPIVIRFVAGYGTAGSDLPEDIWHGLKIMVADLYEARETVVTGTIVARLNTIQMLTENYRAYNFA